MAVKGLGGFHLAADAGNDRAVHTLRERKGRVAKPFALMVRDLAEAERLCRLGDLERSLLLSRERPIVLARRRPNAGSRPTWPRAISSWGSCCLTPRSTFCSWSTPPPPW